MRTAKPAALALLAVVAGMLLAGCGGSESTQDCPTVAREVGDQVNALRGAIGKAAGDPRDAATALRRIQQDLDDIAGHTDGNPAATKAVGDLALAVSNVKNELDKGEPADIKPVTDAAAELTAACPKKG